MVCGTTVCRHCSYAYLIYICVFRPDTSNFGLVFFLGFAPLAFDFKFLGARQQWFEIRISSPRQTVFLVLRALSTRAEAYNAAPTRMMNPSSDMWGISEGTAVPPTALPHPWGSVGPGLLIQSGKPDLYRSYPSYLKAVRYPSPATPGLGMVAPLLNLNLNLFLLYNGYKLGRMPLFIWLLIQNYNLRTTEKYACQHIN